MLPTTEREIEHVTEYITPFQNLAGLLVPPVHGM
jgi:hypothetical protein